VRETYQLFQCVNSSAGSRLGRLEIGAIGVGDREQATLAVLVVGDAEQLGYLLLTATNQMQRRPAGAEPA